VAAWFEKPEQPHNRTANSKGAPMVIRSLVAAIYV